MNLARNLEQAARFFPEFPALVEQGHVTTYAALEAESNRVAEALVTLGLEPGDHAALCLPNGRQWMAVYFGIIKAGGAAVTLAAGLAPAELRPLLADCRPKVLFTTGEKLAALGSRQGMGVPKVVAPGGDLAYEELPAQGSGEFEAVERDRGDVAAVLYTGGTTGTPKGVMLTHENLMVSAHNVARQERSGHEDRVLCFLPLHHVFGQVHVMHSTILTGGCLEMMPAFDMGEVLAAFGRGEITKFYAVPTVYLRLLGQDNLQQRLGRVRYCFSAAASMAQEVVREWKRASGLDIHEAYGMTESASMVTYNHYYRHKVGSVGTPVGSVEVAIMDQEGNVLPQGKDGEICIQGPNIMKGYLNRPEETARAFRGPWFRSGDVGHLDQDGYLYIVDRIKDMIITGGENVYPREVEELLYELPQVAECAVVGLPDREYGEKVTAVIVPKNGDDLDPGELRAYLKKRLSGFKVPKAFVMVPDLPRSAAGKILKRVLKENMTQPPGAPGDEAS
ncbi:MAG: AMP-binding protein [Desulfarculaceae bacterium]|nr:AMP-binding protein [Desulfarculaceae bacterium]MCF8046821.1 AMP-binding protein [Desulfarculaceae bacterium]MCF8097445.1 AMP-binding protein [Desulfarculaceae bacterium]MCF8121410.1 AMP-binding protein [Desulfarculaceae bacterium]